jgi:hypothetical protein
MDIGYEPSRVIQLSRRTTEAIDSLASLLSTDSAAADAIRTIRLTRSNLEDHWMPALRDIERSDAMIRWQASHLETLEFLSLIGIDDSLPDHLRPGGLTVAMPPGVRDELLWRLDLLERQSITGDSERSAGIIPAGAPTRAELQRVGRAVAFWVEQDVGFADELVERSTSNMMIGQLLGAATFSSSFATRVVKQMAKPNGPDSRVDHDRYAASLSTALASLTGDPGACLDLLLDKPTTYALASWDRLDPTILSEFVVSGLKSEVVRNPGRLADGYEVLAHLTRAANGPLDQRFNAGMALGTVTALPPYLDTLSAAISDKTIDTSVALDDDKHAIAADFGTYGDMLGLFGAIVRHSDARVELGRVTATFANDALRSADSLQLFTLKVQRVSEFTTMVIEAAEAEQEQIVAKAAADEKRASDASGAAAVGVDLVLGARGASTFMRRGVSWLTVRGVNWLNRQELEDATITGLGVEIHQQMTITAISMGVAHPGFFQIGQEVALPDDQRDVTEGRLRAIHDASDLSTRNEILNEIVTNIEHTPALLPALNAVTNNAEANALTE